MDRQCDSHTRPLPPREIDLHLAAFECLDLRLVLAQPVDHSLHAVVAFGRGRLCLVHTFIIVPIEEVSRIQAQELVENAYSIRDMGVEERQRHLPRT